MSEVINLNNTAPAAPAGAKNALWQKGATTGADPASGYPIYPVSAYVPDMTGDSGAGGADGLVPAPPAGATAGWKFLRADGTWSAPLIYAVDTGAANAYAVAVTPAPTLAAGSLVAVKIANANTGASTLAVNGGSAIAIVKNGTAALAGGDFAAGQIVELIYDGTNFQWQGGGGSPIYFGQGYATAAAGNNQITLGSLPLAGSLSIFVAGAILTPNAYTLSGAVITLVTALSSGQEVVVNWATPNASPGGITLSTYTPYAVLRGTAMTQGVGPTLTLALPAGTVSGDLIVAFVGTEDNSATLSGSTWTTQNTENPGSFIVGFAFSKTLTSADVTAGSVTLTVLSYDNPVFSIAVFAGPSTAGIREADGQALGTSFTSPVTGPTTSGSVLNSDTALYFAANRSNGSSTDGVNRGTLQQSESPSAHICGCLYLEQIATAGAITPSFSYTLPGDGYYQAIVIVEG